MDKYDSHSIHDHIDMVFIYTYDNFGFEFAVTTYFFDSFIGHRDKKYDHYKRSAVRRKTTYLCEWSILLDRFVYKSKLINLMNLNLVMLRWNIHKSF